LQKGLFTNQNEHPSLTLDEFFLHATIAIGGTGERKFNDSIAQKDIQHCPFKVIRRDGDIPKIQVHWKNERKEFYPEEISVMILEKIKETIENIFAERSRCSCYSSNIFD
jgi:hypothetical protein